MPESSAISNNNDSRIGEFTREPANMPWHSREFIVKDCDGRRLAFGANQ